jgi:hypothetical protein
MLKKIVWRARVALFSHYTIRLQLRGHWPQLLWLRRLRLQRWCSNGSNGIYIQNFDFRYSTCVAARATYKWESSQPVTSEPDMHSLTTKNDAAPAPVVPFGKFMAGTVPVQPQHFMHSPSLNKMAGNCWKWPIMTGNDRSWPEMTDNDWKWPIGPFYTVQDGTEWPGSTLCTVWDGTKWRKKTFIFHFFVKTKKWNSFQPKIRPSCKFHRNQSKKMAFSINRLRKNEVGFNCFKHILVDIFKVWSKNISLIMRKKS